MQRRTRRSGLRRVPRRNPRSRRQGKSPRAGTHSYARTPRSDPASRPAKDAHYSYYIEGIDRLLRDALLEDGWKVGFYTGDDKSGKEAFIHGDLDVLIATA